MSSTSFTSAPCSRLNSVICSWTTGKPAREKLLLRIHCQTTTRRRLKVPRNPVVLSLALPLGPQVTPPDRLCHHTTGNRSHEPDHVVHLRFAVQAKVIVDVITTHRTPNEDRHPRKQGSDAEGALVTMSKDQQEARGDYCQAGASNQRHACYPRR